MMNAAMGSSESSFILFGLFLFITIGILTQLYGLVILYRFTKKKIPVLPTGAPLPGVTIVKTCYNIVDGEKDNFESLFQQDYLGPIQILFAVSDITDPVVPLIKTFLTRFPKIDAEIVVSNTRKAFWKKVDALYDSHKKVKYEFVIWSDSDARIKSNYLSQMVACLSEPHVSVVTTPQFDVGANNFGSALKTLANNCDVTAFVMYVEGFVARKRVGFGQSLGFKKSEFDSFGEQAWEVMNHFLADDQALPYLFHKNGKLVVFRNIYCPVHLSDKSFSYIVKQKVRWLVPQRIAVGSRFFYFLGMFTSPVIASFYFMLFDNFSVRGLTLFASGIVTRLFLSFATEKLVLGSFQMSLRYFWTIPIWDLMQIYFFIAGVFKNTMEVGGRTFKVVDKLFLEEVDPAKPEAESSQEGKLARI